MTNLIKTNSRMAESSIYALPALRNCHATWQERIRPAISSITPCFSKYDEWLSWHVPSVDEIIRRRSST